jgi:hypothetical protein
MRDFAEIVTEAVLIEAAMAMDALVMASHMVWFAGFAILLGIQIVPVLALFAAALCRQGSLNALGTLCLDVQQGIVTYTLEFTMMFLLVILVLVLLVVLGFVRITATATVIVVVATATIIVLVIVVQNTMLSSRALARFAVGSKLVFANALLAVTFTRELGVLASLAIRVGIQLWIGASTTISSR